MKIKRLGEPEVTVQTEEMTTQQEPAPQIELRRIPLNRNKQISIPAPAPQQNKIEEVKPVEEPVKKEESKQEQPAEIIKVTPKPNVAAPIKKRISPIPVEIQPIKKNTAAPTVAKEEYKEEIKVEEKKEQPKVEKPVERKPQQVPKKKENKNNTPKPESASKSVTFKPIFKDEENKNADIPTRNQNEVVAALVDQISSSLVEKFVTRGEFLSFIQTIVPKLK